MSNRFIVVKTCSADACDAIPMTLTSIDVPKVIEVLRCGGYCIVADAGPLCVVEKNGMEMTLYSSGRVLVKTADLDAAEKAVEELYRCMKGGQDA